MYKQVIHRSIPPPFIIGLYIPLVFFLGSIVAEILTKEIIKKGILDSREVKNLAEIYKLACLLHDVGHAPFSHTGECFYKDEAFQSKQLHTRIAELVGEKTFMADIINRESKSAPPHELMSVIVGLNIFETFFVTSEDKEFFARCITGYQYKGDSKINQIRNCFISMLNSKVIDVDRLDYLIRDAYITGYETVNIDYQRLLNAITVVEDEGTYQIAYKKNALSVIENVVYAHDAEKKWIQNHPAVLYETYLLKHIIMRLNKLLNDNKKGVRIFSEKALSKDGVILNNGVKVSLLSDDDIIYLYKTYCLPIQDEEYFDRKNRRHPVWKSESEYNAYIGDLVHEGSLKRSYQDCISFFTGKSKDIPSDVVINDTYIQKLEDELEKTEKASTSESKAVKASLSKNKEGLRSKLQFCNFLQKKANKSGLDCDFVILRADMFQSNFSKEDLAKTLIVFEGDGEENIFQIDSISPTLKGKVIDDSVFYVFYRRKENHSITASVEFCSGLFLAAVKQ